MSRCRKAGGALLIAGLAGVGAAPAVGAQVPTPTSEDTRPLQYETRDLTFEVVSVDGAMTDVQTPAQVQLTLAADVLFAFDKADLTVPAAVTLADLASRIAAQAKGPVRIEGYTDAKGAGAYNVGLSQRRADAVVADLSRRMNGKDVRFEAVGKGATNFVAPNSRADGSDDPEGRARNRRVTITYSR
jgi:OOP family OmpA-OmpF porin